MDELGFDVAVVSINPYWYGVDEEMARKLIPLQNERFAEQCSRFPGPPQSHGDNYGASQVYRVHM